MLLSVEGYRPFGAGHPLKMEIKDGITALVGINNSGKSFVLKFFVEMRALFQQVAYNEDTLIGRQNGFRVSFNTRSDENEIFSYFSSGPLTISLTEKNLELKVDISRENFQATITVIENGQPIPVQGTTVSGGQLRTQHGGTADLNPFIDTLKDFVNARYFSAFRNAVNVGSAEGYYDLSMGEAFIRQWSSTQAGTNPAHRNVANKVTEDLRELFGYKRFNINADPSGKRMFLSINDKSYSLDDLGSGITQFVLVFINAALFHPSFILIDEPELNLHPKLQVDFVNRLLDYTKRGIIFATHSIGLAHSVAENIYSLTPPNDEIGSIMHPYEKTSRFPEFLGELNFSNFPSLGFRKVLLVEGPTDVLVFTALLRKIGKYPDYLIWPLGGNDLINSGTAQQLSEIKRLGPDVQIKCWIDSEKKSASDNVSPGRLAFQSGSAKQGIETTISERRAIENYFPLPAIQSVFPHIASLGEYDTVDSTWHKGSNWRVAQAINIEELRGTDLFDFLEKL